MDEMGAAAMMRCTRRRMRPMVRPMVRPLAVAMPARLGRKGGEDERERRQDARSSYGPFDEVEPAGTIAIRHLRDPDSATVSGPP
jgi:hypothetical protein